MRNVWVTKPRIFERRISCGHPNCCVPHSPLESRDLPQKQEWEETIWAEGKLKSGVKRQMAGRQVNR